MQIQMEKYAHRRNVILGIIKAIYNIVKIGPLMLIVGISMQLQWDPLMCDQYKGAILTNFNFMILFIYFSLSDKIVNEMN